MLVNSQGQFDPLARLRRFGKQLHDLGRQLCIVPKLPALIVPGSQNWGESGPDEAKLISLLDPMANIEAFLALMVQKAGDRFDEGQLPGDELAGSEVNELGDEESGSKRPGVGLEAQARHSWLGEEPVIYREPALSSPKVERNVRSESSKFFQTEPLIVNNKRTMRREWLVERADDVDVDSGNYRSKQVNTPTTEAAIANPAITDGLRGPQNASSADPVIPFQPAEKYLAGVSANDIISAPSSQEFRTQPQNEFIRNSANQAVPLAGESLLMARNPTRLMAVLQANLNTVDIPTRQPDSEASGDAKRPNLFNAHSPESEQTAWSERRSPPPQSETIEPRPDSAWVETGWQVEPLSNQIERLAAEYFQRWLDDLELAYLRSYGAAGG